MTLLLIPVAFLTSCLAGAIGMGGGVLLIALMPGLVPAAAILPIHALVQLASNVSRAAFGWRHIDWTLVPAITVGAFALIGFSFGPWLWLIAAMVVASVVGSWVGTWLRRFIPQVDFQRWFRLLVTLLALRMIALPFLSG